MKFYRCSCVLALQEHTAKKSNKGTPGPVVENEKKQDQENVVRRREFRDDSKKHKRGTETDTAMETRMQKIILYLPIWCLFK